MLEPNYGQPELFREEQHFSGRWLRPVLFALSAFLFLLFGWGFYRQIIQHEAWGDKPMPDAMLIALTMAMLVLAIVLPLLLLRSKLVVTVDQEAVRISFSPFARRNLALAEIAEVQPRKSNPLLEFGGVGVRWTPRGWAYLVSGDMGVQLELAGGKRVFVGSQRPDELAAAITGAKSRR
jgi:hypothetical protein